MTITFTKKHLFVFLLTILIIGFSFALFFAQELQWLFATILGLLVLASVFLVFQNRDKTGIKQKKYSEKKDQQIINKLFYFFIQELKDRGQHKRKYLMPWYIFISKNMASDQATLTHMGFRNSCSTSMGESLPTQIWLKNDAVIISVQMSTQDYRALNCLKFLIKKVSKFRARQTLNGIICSQSIATLISHDKNFSQQLASDNRLIINEIQDLCGQKLPIYVLFNQMAGLADFCQFFASLNESMLEGAFGALNNNTDQLDNYQSSWFNKTYDEMCERMGHAVLTALDSQLSENFRRSVVAAPMQFKQIKPEVSYFLEQLFLNKNINQRYLFRGFFFINTEQSFCATDPLTKQVAYQLGFNEMLPCFDINLSHSIFVNQFFDDYIRPEASSASINIKVKRIFWSFQISYSLAIAAVIASTTFLLKANFDYYRQLNAETFIAIEQYETAVRKTPYDLAGLTSNIENLSMIRDVYRKYNKVTPWYISNLIPNPQLSEAVEDAYHSELVNILLPSMMQYLEDELFVYETLGDTLKTAQLLQLNEEMQIHDLKSWAHLKGYFRESFLQEEHTENRTLNNFLSLMDDIYLLGFPKITLNNHLIKQSKASLDNINATQILFNYIKGLPRYSSNVNISSDLGNNFNQLYQFTGSHSGTLVPYIYTPQGFASLDFSDESELIVQAIEDNKALFRHNLNSSEKVNLGKGLQRLYQRNYINFWLTFIDSVSFKKISPQNLRHSISLLSTKIDGPQAQLYQAIAYYTSPDVPKIAKPVTEKNPLKTKIAGVMNKVTELSTSLAIKSKIARNIQNEFVLYHNFVKQNDKGVSELTNLQVNVTAVNNWLNKARENQSPGYFYFTQLITNKRDPSLYQLSQTSTSIEQVQKHVHFLIKLINNTVKSDINYYINQEWHHQIWKIFTKDLNQKFPFVIDSDTDVNVKAFNRFFKTDGIFALFKAQILSHFKKVNQKLELPGYIEGDPLIIELNAFKTIEQIEQVQQALYQKDPALFSVNYQIKNQTMAAELLSFEMFDERAIYTYSHGPKLWNKFVWPSLSGQNALLIIKTDTKSKKSIEQFDGPWRLLKFIYKYFDNESTKSILNIGNAPDNTRLLLTVDGDINVFDPNFFTRISLPKKIM